MAALPQQDLDRIAAALMRQDSGQVAFTKPQLAAAVAATDAWVEANQASFNSALPAAFRSSATAAQKVMLLAHVLWRKIGLLRVAEDG